MAADILVVGNGWAPDGLPDGVRTLPLAADEGIPAGRNAGVPHVAGDLLFFLDDDASLAAPDALARLAARFAAEPGLGAVQLRVEPRDGGPHARDWVPRLRVGRPRAVERDHRAVGGRGGGAARRASSRRAAGPPPFATCTRGSSSAGA